MKHHKRLILFFVIAVVVAVNSSEPPRPARSQAGEPLEGAVPQYAEVWVASADGHQLYAVSDTAQWRNALAWLPSMSSVQEK